MATELAVGYVTVIPSAKGFSRKLAKEIGATSLGDQIGGDVSKSLTSRIGGALTGITKQVGKVGLGLGTAFGGVALATGYKRLTSIEDATAAITVQLGSAHAAGELLDQVLKAASGTPFSFDQFASATRTLVAMSVPAEKIPGYLTAMGEAAAASGQGAAGLDHVAQSIGKIAASGQLTLEDVWSLSNSGVPALGILANAFGVTRDEMKKLISEGAVPAERALDALTTGIMEGSDGAAGSTRALAGTMDALGETTSGSMANAKAAVARFGADAMKPVFDRLPGVLQSASAGLDALGDKVGPAIEQFMQSERLQSVIDGIGPAFGRAATAAAPFVDRLVEIGRSLAETVGGAIATVGPPLVDMFATLAPKVASVAVSFGEHLAGAIRVVAPILATIVKHGADLVSKVPVSVIAGLAGAFAGFRVIKAVSGPLSSLASGIGGVVKAGKGLASIPGTISSIAKTKGISNTAAAFQTLKSSLAETRAGALGLKVLDSVKSGLSSVGSAAKTAATSAANFAKQGLATAANWAKATAASVASKAAQVAQTVATKAAAAAQWVWNAAMSANPIGLLVAAIAAVVAGLVLAYNKVGWFRDFVNAVFNGIKTVVMGVVNFITTNWGTISDVLMAPFRAAKAVIDPIIEGVKTVIGGVINWVRTNWAAIKAIIEAPIQAAIAYVKLQIEIITTTFRAVSTAVSGIITGIVGFVTAIPGRIRGAVSSILEILKGPFTSAKDWASARIGDIVGFLTGLPGKAKNALVGLGSNILAPFTWGKDQAVSVINRIVDFAKGLPGKVKNALVGLGSALFAPFQWMLDKLKSVWNSTIGRISFTVPSWVPKLGGKGWSFPKMHSGGVVPGGRTHEPIVQLQGGEVVFSRDQVKALRRQSNTAQVVQSGPGLNIEHATFASAVDVDLLWRQGEFQRARRSLAG